MKTHHGLTTTIEGLYTGRPSTPWAGRPATSIYKQPVSGPLKVTPNGLAGDEQADLKVHGGPEKSIHQYPRQHYASWSSELPESKDIFYPGGFGENLSASDFDEKSVCVGDVFRMGTATVQITQGRTPCWKLNKRTGLPSMAKEFLRTGRTGWYYRVLEPGIVCTGGHINLIDRIHPTYTVYRVTRARFRSDIPIEELELLEGLTGLSRNWRSSFANKIHSDSQEDLKEAWKEPE